MEREKKKHTNVLCFKYLKLLLQFSLSILCQVKRKSRMRDPGNLGQVLPLNMSTQFYLFSEEQRTFE